MIQQFALCVVLDGLFLLWVWQVADRERMAALHPKLLCSPTVYSVTECFVAEVVQMSSV